MIIEFIGPPGAGKTTLLPAAAKSLGARGYSPYTVDDAARPFARRTLPGAAVAALAPDTLRDPLLWRVFSQMSAIGRLRFFAGHPRLLRLVRTSQWRRPAAADSRRRRVLYWYYRHAGYFHFLKSQAEPGEVLLFDEGFAHRAVQLFASPVEAPDAGTIGRYLALLPRPDLTIAVMAPVELCEQRIYSRGLWRRFGDKSPAQVHQFVSNAHRAIDMVLNSARRQGWPVLEIDNSADDPAAAGAHLQRLLLAYPFLDGAGNLAPSAREERAGLAARS